MPERGLLARRNLLLLFVIAVSVWLSIDAPAHVWSGLRAALPFGALPWTAGAVASILIFIAAGLCLLRWVLRGGPDGGGPEHRAGLRGLCRLADRPIRIQHRRDGPGRSLRLARGALRVLRMAFIDALSGLPNRRALDEALARLSGNFAVAMIDIDHFKRFNDTHGHAAGDLVLKAIGPQLRKIRGGRAYRYGGRGILRAFLRRPMPRRCGRARSGALECRTGPGADPLGAAAAPAHPGRHSATKPVTVRVTISAGLAERDATARAPAEVLKAADQALYRAKSKGRNCVVAD
jgi:GGDEF domain-containing protein